MNDETGTGDAGQGRRWEFTPVTFESNSDRCDKDVLACNFSLCQRYWKISRNNSIFVSSGPDIDDDASANWNNGQIPANWTQKDIQNSGLPRYAADDLDGIVSELSNGAGFTLVQGLAPTPEVISDVEECGIRLQKFGQDLGRLLPQNLLAPGVNPQPIVFEIP